MHLDEISNNQSKHTGKIARACKQLNDILFTHSKTVIWYYSNDMIFLTVSDAAYVIIPDSSSRCDTYSLQCFHLQNNIH